MTLTYALFGVALLALALYFLPTSIACARSHQNAGLIFLLNLFFGFTMLGWIIAFIWAFSAQPKPA